MPDLPTFSDAAAAKDRVAILHRDLGVALSLLEPLSGQQQVSQELDRAIEQKRAAACGALKMRSSPRPCHSRRQATLR